MESIVNKMALPQELNNIRQHILSFFANLNFNAEKHTYEHGGRAFSSVSSVIKNYTEPFDADKIAIFVAKKRGITKAEVLQEWEDKKNEACNRGTATHTFGENYNSDSVATNGLELAVSNFWKDIPPHIVLVCNELQMFCKEIGVAGTADIILYNTRTKKFIIADYKTNVDLFKNYKGKKMLKPFGRLLDSPYNKYQIQLSLYQYLFEQTGFKVERRIIIWLKPDGTYTKYNTKSYVNVVTKNIKDARLW